MPTRPASQADVNAGSIQDQITAELAKNSVLVASKTIAPGPVNGRVAVDDGEPRVTKTETKQALSAAKKLAKEHAKSRSNTDEPLPTPVNDAEKFTGRRANFEKHREETAKQQDSASSAVDAALAKLQGVASPEPVIEADELDAEADEAEADAPETDADDVPELEGEDADDEDEYEKAVAILRLDGWKSKALSKLSQADVLELASSRQKIRAGVQGLVDELATLKKGQAVAGQEKPREAATAQPATGATSFDVKKATTRIREEWDDKTADAIGEAISSVVTWAQGFVAEKEAAIQPLIAEVGRLQMNDARSRLAEVFPQVRKNENWERVRKQALKLNPTAFDNDVHAMLLDAAEAKFGRVKSTGVPKERVLAARARAQADVSSRTREAEPITADNRIDRVYQALARGDKAEAERIGRS